MPAKRVSSNKKNVAKKLPNGTSVLTAEQTGNIGQAMVGERGKECPLPPPDGIKQDLVNALKKASVEIKGLRIKNERMATRLQMFDDVKLMFNTKPAYEGHSLSEDIAWQIDELVKAVTK